MRKIEKEENKVVFDIDIDPKQTQFAVELDNIEYFVRMYGGRSAAREDKTRSCYHALELLEGEIRKQFFKNCALDQVILIETGNGESYYIFDFEGLYEIRENEYVVRYTSNSSVS